MSQKSDAMNFKFEVNGNVSLSLQPTQETHKYLLENMLKAATDGQVYTIRQDADGRFVFEIVQVGTGISR